MHLDATQGPYRRFNARGLSPAQVAKNFVTPSSYHELIGTLDAQLLVGPRGIGKTTLLKMLLPEALDNWGADEARHVRKQIAFTGVFLQADKLWSGELEQLSIWGDPQERGERLTRTLRTAFAQRQRFATAAFGFMALGALAEAADYRTREGGDERSFRWVPATRTQQEELVGELAPTFLAHKATSTFAGLSEQMFKNLSRLAQLMREAATPGVSRGQQDEILSDRLFTVDFYTAALEFVAAFNRLAKDRWGAWVLLVDEFEFLPPGARQQIGRLFQGGDARLSYKVSLAPYTGTEAFKGSQMNDWHRVVLNRHATDDFTKRMFELTLGDGRPEKRLRGRGFGGQRKDSFGSSTRNAGDVRRLRALDPSFERWLNRILSGRGPAELREDDPALRKLRKVMPLVRLRLEHHALVELFEAGRSPRPEVSELYAGAKSMFLLCEGNPRWIKAIAFELTKDGGKAHYTAARQAEAVAHVSRVLYGNLRAMTIQQRTGIERREPPADTGTAKDKITPFGMLTRLGNCLHIATNERSFTDNVPSIFQIDKQDIHGEDVLNSLIFLGALVVEPASKKARFERVRLAHMWAPLFELLPAKGTTRRISKVLAEDWEPKHSLLKETDRLAEEEDELDGHVSAATEADK